MADKVARRHHPEPALVRKIASDVVKPWIRGLSDDAKMLVSAHDAAALAEVIAYWSVNEGKQ